MADEQMENTLQEIKKLADACYKHETYWKVKEMELLAPAKDADIHALSKELPFPLPPSYVEFLKLHNGCMYFWPKSALTGSKGKPFEILKKQLEENLIYQNKRVLSTWQDKEKPTEPAPGFKDADEMTAWLLKDTPEPKFDKKIKPTKEQIELYESWSANPHTHHLYLPNHIVFGTNGGGTFWLFNENKKDKNGEYEVIYYAYDIGVHERYENFNAYLSYTLQKLQKRVKEKKYKV